MMNNKIRDKEKVIAELQKEVDLTRKCKRDKSLMTERVIEMTDNVIYKLKNNPDFFFSYAEYDAAIFLLRKLR